MCQPCILNWMKQCSTILNFSYLNELKLLEMITWSVVQSNGRLGKMTSTTCISGRLTIPTVVPSLAIVDIVTRASQSQMYTSPQSKVAHFLRELSQQQVLVLIIKLPKNMWSQLQSMEQLWLSAVLLIHRRRCVGWHPSTDWSRNRLSRVQYEGIMQRLRNADFDEANAAADGEAASKFSM